MSRREVRSAIAVAASLLAAVWILSGCGELPTAPHSPTEEAAFTETASGLGVEGLSAAPPVWGGSLAVSVADQRDERDAGDVSAAPDSKGGLSPTVGIIESGSSDGKSSRYALASARM
jgi:hypothetical protein